ncbi:MAG TPA: hypothetical protein VFL81_00295 [Candidatus Saccharimonadales bacterium]|nr:hypothetical protein [Candidatus Saccharimonadales bacterium]
MDLDIFRIIVLLIILAETSFIAYKRLDLVKLPKASIVVDTSALIDGRLVSIARSGLVTAPLIVPKSVVEELQFMADRADHDKRERARFGLDVIDNLKSIDGVDLRVVDDRNRNHLEVDAQLIELAKRYSAKLLTIDYNLNKAAKAQGVIVVNINELAHALRVVHLPGETAELKLVQPGQERDQAVGYLDDGTMVVVDSAKALINQTVEVSITRVLQTSAGKMMFAKLASPAAGPKAKANKSRTNAKSKPAQRSRRGRSAADQAEDSLVDLANR